LQLDEDEESKGNKDYVNFKRVVWHASFLKLLETLEKHCHTGCMADCGDNIWRLLWPLILILSADYEEQYGVPFVK